MLPDVPAWASELASVRDGDELLPSRIEGINVVMNRARLAAWLAAFAEDRDVRDLFVLDELAGAAALPISSTGIAEVTPGLALRPFRIWEYTWLYKTLGLSKGALNVLDLGGPASHLSILAALAGCKVTSIDINPTFVEAGQECARDLNLSSLDPQVGDMRDLSRFSDGSFDIVLSCSVLEHLSAIDQQVAVREVSRVLRPGGIVGLTFDYGQSAAGANVYLPPPHDPPPNAAEALRRYQHPGLVVVGNAFSENPIPGALFRDDAVSYTIASLFLAKPPLPEIRIASCEPDGSCVGALVINKLPSRIHRGAAHATSAGIAQDSRILELEESARARLAALEKTDELLQATSKQAEARERGLHELTSIVEAQNTRIQELEFVARERLTALEKADVNLRDTTKEAEERERGLHELTAIVETQSARIQELELVARERLTALEKADVNLRDTTKEAEERERGLHELTAIVRARNVRIEELELVARERLTALEQTDEMLHQKTLDEAQKAAELRRVNIALQDAEAKSASVRELLLSAEDALTRCRTREDDLNLRIVAFENENLLRSILRRLRK